MNTNKEYYQENVVPALMDRFKFKSNKRKNNTLFIIIDM